MEDQTLSLAMGVAENILGTSSSSLTMVGVKKKEHKGLGDRLRRKKSEGVMVFSLSMGNLTQGEEDGGIASRKSSSAVTFPVDQAQGRKRFQSLSLETSARWT